jgi:L-2-hydroxyglutarate oxidase LhgO
LIFAAHEGELAALDAIARDGRCAGVDDLVRMDRREARALEPELESSGAILSPSTGIIDSHALTLSLLADAESHGATLARSTCFARAEYESGAWKVFVAGERAAVVEAPALVNAAGLGAQSIAHSIEGLARVHVPRLHLARGVYFIYTGPVPFRHLIYPLPEPGGLGTHLTLDLSGRARFGPDVEWIDRIDYRVDPNRKDQFVAAARRIWPKLDPRRVQPGYAGIRPKIVPRDSPAADFVISGRKAHGLDGLINLFGIESPGLTASLAIAEHVQEMLE